MKSTRPLGRSSAPAALLLVASLGALIAAPAAAQDWRARHGDSGRTGQAAGQGDITNPAVSWRLSLGEQVPGASMSVVDLDGDGTLENVALLGGALVARDFQGTVLWDTAPLGLSRFVGAADLDGDGAEELLYAGRLNAAIDPRSGRVLWRTSPTNGFFYTGTSVLLVNADADPELEVLIASIVDRNLVLWDFSGGFAQAERRWEAPSVAGRAFPTNIFRPVVGDFDGDGAASEIAVVNQANCQALFFNLADGALLHASPALTQGTSCLGTATARNLDADPQDELIFTGQQANSTNSASITVYDLVNTATQWQYEYGVNNSALNVQAPPSFIGDLDGDGAVEVVLSIYGNGAEISAQDDGVSAEDDWVTLVYDGATGATLGVLQERLLIGLHDLSGDGNPELITRTVLPNSNAVPEAGDTAIYQLDAQRAPALGWTLAGSIPVQRSKPLTPDTNVWSNNAVESVLERADGSRELLVAGQDGGSTAVRLARLGAGDALEVTASANIEGGRFLTLVDASAAGILAGEHLLLSTTTGLFGLYDGALAPQGQVPVAGFTSWQVITSLSAGSRHMILQDARRELVAYDLEGANALQAPVERWRQPLSTGDFLALDIDDDGTDEIAWLGLDPDSVNFVAVTDGDGTLVWKRRFEGLIVPLKGLVAGRFGGAGSADVGLIAIDGADSRFVYTLSGTTGDILASRRSPQSEVRQFGNRDLLVVGDRNSDGMDDLVVTHYSTFEQLSGADLTRLTPVQTLAVGTIAINEPAFIPGGSLGGGLYTRPLTGPVQVFDLAPQGAVWSVEQPATTQNAATSFVGFADVDGDDALDIATPGLFGEVTVYSGATGAVLYRVCLNEGVASLLAEPASTTNCAPLAAPSNVAAADIDGDGDQEFLVGGAGGWLYALHVEDGSVLWRADVGGQPFYPALADTDGDGALEVIVSTRRSEVLVVDQSSVQAVAEVRDVAVSGGQITDAATDLDTTMTRGALGVAWDAADGADRYLIRILTSNGTVLVPTTDVGASTSRVFTNLALIAGTTYTAEVTAVSDQLGTGPVTRSDGVRLLGNAPALRDVSIAPDPFTRLVDTTVNMTLSASADGNILLQSVSVSVEDEATGELVFTETRMPENRTFASLTFTWDARDTDGDLVLAGPYLARFRAVDADGATREEVQGWSVRDLGTPLITDLLAEPPAFSPAGGQSTRVTATVEADRVALLTELRLQVEDSAGAVVRTWVTNPLADTAQLDQPWAGDDEEGALVAPGVYTLRLIATDNRLGSSEAITQVEVVEAEAPIIDAFAASPTAFTPALGETTALAVDARSETTLTEARIVIAAINDAVVFEEVRTLDAATASFVVTWDGLEDGAPVAPGTYTATLRVTNLAGLESTSSVEVTVLEPGQSVVLIEDAAVAPSSFDACQGGAADITATVVSTTSDLELVSVTIRADDIVVRDFTFGPGLSARYGLSVSWDGLDDAGAVAAPGTYEVDLFGQAADGASAAETLQVTVTCGGAPNNNPNNTPTNNGPGPDPDPAGPEGEVGGGGGLFSCAAAPGAAGGTPWGGLLVLAGLAWLLRRRG